MNPVARMTPATNAFMMKYPLRLDRMGGIHFPRMEMHTSMNPPTRTEKMAASLRGRATNLSRLDLSTEQSQLARAMTGRSRRRKRVGLLMFVLGAIDRLNLHIWNYKEEEAIKDSKL